MVLGLEHRESNSAHESQTANEWNQAGGRKSLGCSPEDTVMPCCQAASSPKMWLPQVPVSLPAPARKRF